MAKKNPEKPKTRATHWGDLVDKEQGPVPGSGVARWRLFRKWIKVLFAFTCIGVVGVAVYFGVKEVGIMGETQPYSGSRVRFETNEGRLTAEWFVEYIGLNRGANLSIFEIKEKLSSLGQIEQASVHENMSGELVVRVRERVPIVRLEGVLKSGERVIRVVALDGVVYQGINYSSMVFQNLPELTGAVAKHSEKGDYDVIPGMDVVGSLLLRARKEHPALYQEWESISVKDFVRADVSAPGASLRIRLRQISQPSDAPRIRDVVFSAGDCMNEFVNYYSMLGFLDSILARLSKENKERFPLFDLYLSLENKTDPNKPYKEPRLIPVTPEDSAQ